jgi:thioredoxin 1
MLPTVNDESFQKEVLDSKLPVLVKFSADWCQPCKVMTETLRDLIPELGNHVRFVEVNIEHSPNAANTYGIRGLPMLILFKKGDAMASQNGNSPKPKVRQWIINSLGL